MSTEFLGVPLTPVQATIARALAAGGKIVPTKKHKRYFYGVISPINREKTLISNATIGALKRKRVITDSLLATQTILFGGFK